jgi:(S)-ureidoglycine aminohydrolase
LTGREVDGRKGETRSVLRVGEFLLHTPDAFVRTPLPGLRGGAAIVHASPRLGAEFAQYTVELEAGGVLALPDEGETERLVWVAEGVVHALGSELQAGGYGYLPPDCAAEIRSAERASVSVIERRYKPLAGVERPKAFVGHEDECEAVPLGGDEEVLVRGLLPAGMQFDFAVNTMAYAPGAVLSQVEVHVMEHGLVMLEGAGRYRLGAEWFEVERGDFIWMAGFCPQWFEAGRDGAKYLIYKDWNRKDWNWKDGNWRMGW